MCMIHELLFCLIQQLKSIKGPISHLYHISYHSKIFFSFINLSGPFSCIINFLNSRLLASEEHVKTSLTVSFILNRHLKLKLMSKMTDTLSLLCLLTTVQSMPDGQQITFCVFFFFFCSFSPFFLIWILNLTVAWEHLELNLRKARRYEWAITWSMTEKMDGDGWRTDKEKSWKMTGGETPYIPGVLASSADSWWRFNPFGLRITNTHPCMHLGSSNWENKLINS